MTTLQAQTVRRPALGRVARFFGIALVAFMLSTGITSRAAAQDVSNDIITSAVPLSSAQLDSLKEFIKPLLESLKSDDANKIRDARLALIRPLQKAGVTVGVPFRQAYSGQLGRPLAELADDKRPLNAINAMRIGAELATAEGFDVIEKGFSSPVPAIRVAAAGAAARAFVVAGGSASAVVPKRLFDAVTALGKMLDDADPIVVDAAARALVNAMVSSKAAEVRNNACIALCKGLSARAAKLKSAAPAPEMIDAFRRSALAMREELTQGMNTRPPLSGDANRSIQEFAGDMIAMVVRLVSSGALPQIKQADTPADRKQKEAAREAPSQLVGASEQILSLIADKTEPIRTNFAEKIRQATVNSDANFIEDAKKLLGPGGRLTRAPFGLADARFDLSGK
ncbi:MAG: hypothetical protein JSS51_01690 [Planctomycetes bacterium]|nr:hypothetical protein [Planctomycetota bacterium]